jgi:beta-aspartyl-peptidase (threonine type)
MLVLGVCMMHLMHAHSSAQSPQAAKGAATTSSQKVVLAIHGGAGTILRKTMTAEKEAAITAALTQSLKAGYEVIQKGGTSMDAVQAAILVMEDSPLFNAGKGAVFASDGKNELDAAVMDGKTHKAGAIAGVRHIKNPIVLARAVMERSEHVLLTREGAEEFALQQGFTLVPTEYFYTPQRWENLMKEQEQERDKRSGGKSNQPDSTNQERKHGTVGAVALDNAGNLAAGTSTGGMTNKKWGRVGDAPLIGAGTYADNATCAVSATGHGEYFIRAVVAHDIAARMRYKGISVKQAADEVVMKRLVEMGGTGGVIALDAKGNVALPFNTEGMYRGCITEDGTVTIGIYR